MSVVGPVQPPPPSAVASGRWGAPVAGVMWPTVEDRATPRRQVQPVDHLNNKPCQMPLGKPFIKRWRKQKSRLAIKLTEIAHRVASRRESIAPGYPASPIIR